MSTIDVNSQLAGTGNNVGTGLSSNTPTGSSALGENEFMKMLMAQMQNQDPTQPMDNQAMVAQLATFSQLQLQTDANSKLDSLILAQTSNNQTSVASLVGKNIAYNSNKLHLGDGTTPTIRATLTTAAASTSAVVSDSTGKTVRTLQLGAEPQGAISIPFDGKDDNGNALPAGDYTVTVAGKDTQGAAVAVTQTNKGVVTGISFANGYAELLVSGVTIKLSDVSEIDQ